MLSAALLPRDAAAQTMPSSAAQPGPAPADACASLGNLVSRPTFGTAACTVAPGGLLVEAGYTNSATGGVGANAAVVYPQANLRVGLGHRLEFDVDPASIERVSGSPAVSGATDTALGIKEEFVDAGRVVFGANVLYTLNSGDAQTSGNGDGVLANLNASYALSPALGLFATLGYNAQSAGSIAVPARYHGVDPSFGASVALPASFTFALEGFGQSATAPGSDGRFGADAAVERDLGSRVQLDLNVFAYPGVHEGAHLHAIGFGAAYLIGP